MLVSFKPLYFGLFFVFFYRVVPIEQIFIKLDSLVFWRILEVYWLQLYCVRVYVILSFVYKIHFYGAKVLCLLSVNLVLILNPLETFLVILLLEHLQLLHFCIFFWLVKLFLGFGKMGRRRSGFRALERWLVIGEFWRNNA